MARVTLTDVTKVFPGGTVAVGLRPHKFDLSFGAVSAGAARR